MSFSAIHTENSEFFPGVQFTVKRIGLAPRAELDQKTLKHRQRLRELELEYPERTPKEEELAEQLEIARKKLEWLLTPAHLAALEECEKAQADVKALAKQLMGAATLETRKQRQVIDEEYATVQGPIRLIWVQAGLVSLSGGEVDGMTAEELLDHGPPELAQEIYETLTGQGRLAGPAAKNSSSPGTSGAQADLPTNNTTVAAANEPDGMPSATVSSILQPASIRDSGDGGNHDTQ